MIILAIETSCDETAAAIIDISGRKEKTRLKILANIVASQVNLHRQYGGIVPEVAARAHLEQIMPTLNEAFHQARLTKDKIDLIGVTNGPGLITSLLVGAETAKTLSYILNKPLLGINHLAGHFYAAFANLFLAKETLKNKEIFPAVGLIVSGGHTELVLMKNWYQFQKLGQTLDDAAGECFDKIAKFLNLGYPGGPAIAAMANQHKFTTNFTNKNNSREFANKFVNISDIQLPRPMLTTRDFNFSFSGLKTAVLYFLKDKKNSQLTQNDVFISNFCGEVQRAAIDVLISKTLKAARRFDAKSIILGGGVAANQELRKQFKLKIENCLSAEDLAQAGKLKINFLVPPKNLCTDNALMIAVATYFRWQKMVKKQKLPNWQQLKIDPNQSI